MSVERNPVQEIDPGPWEIRVRDTTSETRVGFAWFQGNMGVQESFFVLKNGVPFPLPHKEDVIFSPHSMSGVENADEFYKWVMESGELGKETSTWQARESYETWK